jgi:hypothetical protein
MIDGRSIAPGEVGALTADSHWFRPDGTGAEAVLRWAKAMEPPASDPVGILPFFGVDRPIK